jgi:N-methylhydantoinase B
MSTQTQNRTLDPVTFEVLKNAFVTAVDLMAEQILRTCHSFVIYARDFSSALCDRHGNTIMQGSQDIAVHVGTLHFTCKAVIDAFEGDIHPGDIFAINDPYLGGTHFCDVRIVKPIFHGDEIIAFAQSNGHWADVGGSVPGSFDINAKDHFGEGLRIPPIRLYDRGVFRRDIARMIASASRAPSDIEGDMQAQIEATRVCEREILRLVGKYGIETVLTAFDEVQDYVERLTRQRVAELPDGTWETEDYIDYDPDRSEGLVPIKVKLTIEGDQIHYDLNGSHPAVGTFLNSGFGATFSGLVAGTKTFFPDIPLNSGFYRVVSHDLGPVGSVVNAPWPTAVTGFCAGPYEKIMNACFEIWSEIMPERAIAASFNLEYLLVGGRDLRTPENPYLHGADLRRGARRPAARGAGTPVPGAHDPALDRDRLRRPGQVPRRLRRREGRHAHRRPPHGDVLLLRPGALGHLRYARRPALAPPRRVAEQGPGGRAVPRRRLLERAHRAGGHVHAALGRRRRHGRSAGTGSRGRPRGRDRRVRVCRAGPQGLRRGRGRDRRRARRAPPRSRRDGEGA